LRRAWRWCRGTSGTGAGMTHTGSRERTPFAPGRRDIATANRNARQT
jgi:hypothetical protein